MPASVLITKSKNAAVSVEPLASGNFEVAVEVKKVFGGNKVDAAHAILSREEITTLRDTLTAVLEA